MTNKYDFIDQKLKNFRAFCSDKLPEPQKKQIIEFIDAMDPVKIEDFARVKLIPNKSRMREYANELMRDYDVPIDRVVEADFNKFCAYLSMFAEVC